MRVDLNAPFPARDDCVRSFELEDIPDLGDLMYRAYLDTVDYEGETLDQAADEIQKTVRGEYGEFVPSCSMVATREGSLVSATLITRYQNRPFVAFTFTDPRFKGHGLARAAMQAAMSELHVQGEQELRLVVTLSNVPAVKLYTRLGFQLEQR